MHEHVIDLVGRHVASRARYEHGYEGGSSVNVTPLASNTSMLTLFLSYRSPSGASRPCPMTTIDEYPADDGHTTRCTPHVCPQSELTRTTIRSRSMKLSGAEW